MTGSGNKAPCFPDSEPVSLEMKKKHGKKENSEELLNTTDYLGEQKTGTQSDDAFFLERVLDSLTHPFYVIDAQSYKVTLANKAARNSFSSIGTTCHSLTHGRDSPCDTNDHRCPLIEVKKTKQPVMVEHLHYDTQGNARYMEVHGYPILDDKGRVVQMIEYNLDVTERTKVKRTLQTTNQMATLFLDIMSHDIINQLQVILFSKEFLQNLNVSGEMAVHFQHLLALIDESAYRCMNIISKAQFTGKLMTVPLFERRLDVVLQDCLEFFLDTPYKSQIDFVNEVGECLILADEFLEQVFMNLFENALLHNSSNNRRIWIHLMRMDSEFKVSISDNGQGIPESLRSSLFDASRRSGGIGLHQSNHILQKYDGGIEVSERIVGKPELGTEILVRLPEKQKQL